MSTGAYAGAWLTVVGVVGDARYRELTVSRLDLYVSDLQSNHRLQQLLVRTRRDPASLAGAVRGVVRTLQPDRPAPEIVTMAHVVSEALAVPRFAARVLGAFSLLAVLLSLLGLYGIVAHSVARRTREIGVRVSLGAAPADIGRLVLGHTLRLAGAGVLLGVAAAFVTTRLLSGLLFNVPPTDAATFVSAAVTLLAGAGLAGLVPVRRAVRVDPAVALRHE